MKRAIATTIATATAIELRAHEGSLAPIVARTGDLSSFMSLYYFYLRLHDSSFLSLIKVAFLPRPCPFGLIFFFDGFALYVLFTMYFSSVHVNIFLRVIIRLAVHMFKKLIAVHVTCLSSGGGNILFVFWHSYPHHTTVFGHDGRLIFGNNNNNNNKTNPLSRFLLTMLG